MTAERLAELRSMAAQLEDAVSAEYSVSFRALIDAHERLLAECKLVRFMLEGDNASEFTLAEAVKELLCDFQRRGEWLKKAEAERDTLREKHERLLTAVGPFVKMRLQTNAPDAETIWYSLHSPKRKERHEPE